MAFRTTDDLVEAIIEVDSSIVLTPFIAAANAIVTQCCSNLSVNYSTEELQQIETWLSAHMYTVRDGRAFREKAGSVSEELQSKVALGFSTSHYGQTAMRLDYYGGLAALDASILRGRTKAPSVTWLGKTRDEVNDS
jgi:hypothetical protein